MKFKIFLLFFFVKAFTYAQTEIYHVEDTTNVLNLKEVITKDFTLIKNVPLDGSTNSTHWFKIPAINNNSTYILRVNIFRLLTANAYQDSKKLTKLPNQRFLSYRFLRDKPVYLQIKAKYKSQILLEIEHQDNAIYKEKKLFIINGFYYGFAFLIILYNLFYFSLFKDIVFLYYALFLTSITSAIFLIDGMPFYFDVNQKTTTFLMIINYVLIAFFSSKFANSYLFLERYFPNFKKIAYVVGIIIIFCATVYLITEEVNYFILLNSLVFTLFFVFWFAGVLLFKKNFYTKAFVLAYVIILFSGIDFFILKRLGLNLIKSDISIIKIGGIVEMIVLSLAVLYRMKILKSENAFMKNEIIKYDKEIKKFNTNNKDEIKTDARNNLSLREKEIFDLIVSGNSNKEIANTLNISINTVKFHVKNIYEKLHISSRKEAVILEKSFK